MLYYIVAFLISSCYTILYTSSCFPSINAWKPYSKIKFCSTRCDPYQWCTDTGFPGCCHDEIKMTNNKIELWNLFPAYLISAYNSPIISHVFHHTLACYKCINNACEQGIGRLLCKAEEAEAWIDQVPSIGLIIYSFIFYWVMESPRQTHKCITIKVRGEEIDSFGVLELFEDELAEPLSSNYYLSVQQCRTESEESREASAGILSFAWPNTVCSSLAYAVCSCKIIAVYCQLH